MSVGQTLTPPGAQREIPLAGSMSAAAGSATAAARATAARKDGARNVTWTSASG